MKNKPFALVLIVLLATQLFCAAPPPPAPSQAVGQVEKLQGAVQAGPETALSNVDPRREMYNNDAVRVFDNGKANLDFGYGLTFTLYNNTVGAGTNVITEGTSHQAVLKLSEGGLKGHNPDGSRTTVELPNGVDIFILGTNYFIIYDPAEERAWVYNFDGAMAYQLPGGNVETLFPGDLIEINDGQIIRQSGLSFSLEQFDSAATRLNSPIEGVKEILTAGIPVTSQEETPATITATATSTATATGTTTATSTMTATPTLTATPTPTSTSTPTRTATPVPCYLARFVADVTIPDETIFDPYTAFTKTWRLRNEGSCVWDSSYQIVMVDGTLLSEIDEFPWTGGTVGYGQTVDISVDLYSPEAPGKHQGNFMLLAPDGTLFGLGSENQTFWVRIVVEVPNSPPGVPTIVNPQQGEILYCNVAASLDWNIPYDDGNVVEYEVMLETWTEYCFSWCSVFGESSVFVSTDYLDITQYLGCDTPYRWNIRARDNEGAWSGWSGWVEFTTEPYIE